MAESIRLTLGLAVTPRTRALFDGTVQPEGIQLRCESDRLDNTGARRRAILGGVRDGGMFDFFYDSGAKPLPDAARAAQLPARAGRTCFFAKP
jgi:hypothetical protein